MVKNVNNMFVIILLTATLALLNGCDDGKSSRDEIKEKVDLIPVSEVGSALSIKSLSFDDEDTFDFLADPVASVNGKKISKAEFLEFFKTQLPNGRLPNDMTKEKLELLAPELLKKYLIEPFILQEAEKIGLVPNAEMIKKDLSSQFAKYNAAQTKKLNESLAQQGITLNQYIDNIANNKALQNRLIIELFIENVVYDPVVATEVEIEKYYEANRDKFQSEGDEEGSIRASHILVSSLPDAEAIYAELQEKPAKFAEIARKKSTCPSKEKGGDLGAFTKGRMVAEFEIAAFELEEGEISKPVKSQFGYHLIRRDYSEKAGPIEFKVAKVTIEPIIIAENKQKALAEFYEKLYSENGIEIFLNKK